MLKIYLTRHGQDQDNKDGILNGHRNNTLTEKGLEQAFKIAEKIKGTGLTFEAIYVSPLQRAFQTAQIISDALLKAPKPVIEPLLIERNFGIMTGEKVADIEKICAPNIIKAEIITYFISCDGAETFPDLMARGKLLINKLAEKYKDGNILLVTHGDMGKMIYAQYYGLDWEKVLTQFHFGNCDLLLLSKDSPPGESHVFKILQYNH